MRKLTFVLLILLLTSCGSKADSPAPTPTLFTDSGGPSDIQVLVASNDFPIGQPRVPLLLFSGAQRVADAQRVELTAFDLAKGTPVPGWTGQAVSYSDYAVPYWVAYPVLPHAGLWGFQAVITKGDGVTTSAQLVIETKDNPTVPPIGAQPPRSKNRTLTIEPDLRKLTSAAEPTPAFYQMTIAEAMQSGRPSVIVFATPGFCKTALCTPVLQSVETVYPVFKDRLNFIHVEIYKQFDPALVVDDTVTEWQLDSEPWTFILDKDGTVFARFSGPVSPRELTAAFKELGL